MSVENNSLLVPASSAPFTEGAAVRASINSGANAGPSSPQPLLGLPQRRLGGLSSACDWMPVQFLGNASSVCMQAVTSTSCAAGGALSADAYVTSRSLYFSVLAGTGSLLSSTATAAVTYYCLNQSASSSDSSFEAKATQSSTRFFAPSSYSQSACYDLLYQATAGLPNATDTVGACYTPDVDASFQKYLAGSECAGGSASEPPVAKFDGSQCENAVLAVNYTLYWSGAQVTGLIGTLLLGTITLPSWSVNVTQRTSYTWSYLPASQQSQINASSNGSALTPSQLGITSRSSLVGVYL